MTTSRSAESERERASETTDTEDGLPSPGGERRENSLAARSSSIIE